MEIIHRQNPSGRTTALQSTQPLTEMNARNISYWCGRDKGYQCVRLQTVPSLLADSLEIWEPQRLGCNGPEQELLYI